MFNCITNAQDGFYRHHNAKPSVRRSVLYYQFLFLVFVLGGWPSGRRRKHATTNIWTSVPNIINFCFRGPAVPAAAKTRKSQYIDYCTRQLFIFLALQPHVGTCQPVCCWEHPHYQSNPSFVLSENLQDLHQRGVPSHLLESPGSIPQSSSTFERTAGVPPGASIFPSFCSPRSII